MFTSTLIVESEKLRKQGFRLGERMTAAIEVAQVSQKASAGLCARSQDLRGEIRRCRAVRKTRSRGACATDLCLGTVVIHRDLTVTCTECTVSDRRSVANRHIWFIACEHALGSLCPRCEKSGAVQGDRRSRRL